MEHLRHTRSTSKAGFSALVAVGAVAALLIVGQVIYFPQIWQEHPWLAGALYASLAVNVLAALVYASLNFMAGEDFICQLDDEYLECISPVRSCGESFRVAIADIAKVEKNHSGDSTKWYVHDRAGNRFWLTDCYENPAGAFVTLIKAGNPAVLEVDG